MGDAACIRKVIAIIRSTAELDHVVVVVSAMSGVTNKLIEAASHARAGDQKRVARIFEELRTRHYTAVRELIESVSEQDEICLRMEELFQFGELLCQDAIRDGELTPQVHDAISSLGEKLCAPLVAAALAKERVPSAAVDAVELIVTDARHGAADPQMDLTRDRCEARLRPLLQNGIIPVVTGFIGATPEGTLTTLGRGGSDYSATILGAALGADEVVIWTDVDGLHTADPRMVPGTRTISEISYREAAELAHLGAKVLHPKTLRPVKQSGIPLWIRNTFAPHQAGTKITPDGPDHEGTATAVSLINEVAFLTITAPGIANGVTLLSRVLATTGALEADVLLLGSLPSADCIWLVVPGTAAARTASALGREFAEHFTPGQQEYILVKPAMALLTIVGQKSVQTSETTGRMSAALARESVPVFASAQGSSECSVSLVVAHSDAKIALIAVHRELQLGKRNPVPLAGMHLVNENAADNLESA